MIGKPREVGVTDLAPLVLAARGNTRAGCAGLPLAGNRRRTAGNHRGCWFGRGVLDLLDCQAEPTSWRQFAGLGGRRLLRPDMFLALGVGAYELRWFIEVDRASESLPVIRRKCRLYADYYQSGTEQAGRGGVFPRVCWIVPDEVRAERVWQTIARDSLLPKGLFVVTTNPEAVNSLCEITKNGTGPAP